MFWVPHYSAVVSFNMMPMNTSTSDHHLCNCRVNSLNRTTLTETASSVCQERSRLKRATELRNYSNEARSYKHVYLSLYIKLVVPSKHLSSQLAKIPFCPLLIILRSMRKLLYKLRNILHRSQLPCCLSVETYNWPLFHFLHAWNACCTASPFSAILTVLDKLHVR